MGLFRTALVLALGAWHLSACAANPTDGYTAISAFPSGYRTVAVPIFSSASLVRDVEFDLTDALIKEIERRTPYKVVPESRADTILLGQVRTVQLGQLSKSRLTGLSEEVVVTVTIDFSWKDLRTGRALVERQSFSGHGLFVPSRPSGEPVELGRFAAVQQLARDIVAELRSEW